MPVSAAQVFGPTTVDPGFNSTGEKTLLTMSTTLPAGGKNVIIAILMQTSAVSIPPVCTLRIKKGATILYETYSFYIQEGSGRSYPHMLMAVDTSPAGNDAYAFTINITTAGSTSAAVHVQGIVIKADDASIAYNTSAVSIAAGGTATITSLNTSYSVNSNVAALAYVLLYHTVAATHYMIGAGNVKLKQDTTVISQIQFNVGSYGSQRPGVANLAWLGTVTSGSQAWSVEVTNGSSTTFYAYAILVTFTVATGGFLDTASVALTNGSQVTVGNLSTTLTGDVVVIAIVAADNTSATDNLVAFNANDVVLQKDNSSTGQIANLVGWIFSDSNRYGRSGYLPLVRLDTDATNPSYQIKMTSRASKINGEAKILAFLISVGVPITVSDSGSGAEVIMVNVTASDSGSGVESLSLSSSIPVSDASVGVEMVNMSKEALDSGVGYEYFTGGQYNGVDDAGAGVEYVDMSKETLDVGMGIESIGMKHEALDSGVGVDMIFSPRYNPLTDYGAGVDTALIQVPQSDAGAGFDASTVTGIIPVFDSGSGIDIITQMTKAIIDSGRGVEAVYVSASVIAYDSGIGTDIIGIVAQISVEDFGKGAEFADWFLSMYGMVLVDNEQVGIHSIPYNDWKKNNIPVQVHRRSVGDKVYIDDDNIGDVVVEWEDKVSDVVPGERTVIVTGVVELYD